MTFRWEHSTRKWNTEVLLERIFGSYTQSKISYRKGIERGRGLSWLRLSQKGAWRSLGLLKHSVFVWCPPSKSDVIFAQAQDFIYILHFLSVFSLFYFSKTSFFTWCVHLKGLHLQVTGISATSYGLRPHSWITQETTALIPLLRKAHRMSFK